MLDVLAPGRTRQAIELSLEVEIYNLITYR